ncbi:MAG: hypothetical protein NTZ68_03520 [Candidatus Dependentiae bacterium]|nr:hypothetical protein [Candidatus Dependentiae bacterium]
MENLRLSKPLAKQKELIIRDTKKINNFNWPLSDLEIIKLQNIFMTPGLHHISTENILSGRVLTDNILKSLQYYNFIGCLTTSQILSDLDIANMYELYLDCNEMFEDTCSLEDLFIDCFHFDFVYIELSEDLLSKISLKKLQSLCEALTARQSIAVVMISYENC